MYTFRLTLCLLLFACITHCLPSGCLAAGPAESPAPPQPATALETVLTDAAQAGAAGLLRQFMPADLARLLTDLQASGDLTVAGELALTNWAAGLAAQPAARYGALATRLLAGDEVDLGPAINPATGNAAQFSALPAGEYLLSFEGTATMPELELSLKQLLEDTETLAERLRRIDSLPEARKMLKLRGLDPGQLDLKLSLGKGLRITRRKTPDRDTAAVAARSLLLTETPEGWMMDSAGFAAEELAPLLAALESGPADGVVNLPLPAQSSATL